MKHEENVWSHHDPIWLRKKRNRNESRPMTNDTTRGTPRTDAEIETDRIERVLSAIEAAPEIYEGFAFEAVQIARKFQRELADSSEARGEGELTEAEREAVDYALKFVRHEDAFDLPGDFEEQAKVLANEVDRLRLRPQAAREWDAESIQNAPEGWYFFTESDGEWAEDFDTDGFYLMRGLSEVRAIANGLIRGRKPRARFRAFGPLPLPASPQKEGRE